MTHVLTIDADFPERKQGRFDPLIRSGLESAEIIILLLIVSFCTVSGWRKNRVFAPFDLASSPAANTNDPRVRETFESIAWTQIALDRFSHGAAPLWDSRTQMGIPLIGIGRSAVFFPTMLFHLALPPTLSWLLAAWVKLLAAALGAWFLARRHKMSAVGRCLTALTFGLSGIFVQASHDAAANVAAIAPWTILAMESLIDHLTPARVTALSIAAFLMFLGGDPSAIVSLVLLGFSIWVALLIFDQGSGPSAVLFGSLAILLALAVAFLAAAVQTFPLVEYFRALPDISSSAAFHWPQTRLVMFLINAPWFSSGLIGILGIFLAIWAVVSHLNHPRVCLWLAAILIWLFAWVALVEILSYLAPSLSYTITGPGAILGLLLSVAMLAGLGIDGLNQTADPASPDPSHGKPLIAASIAACGVCVCLLILAIAIHTGRAAAIASGLRLFIAAGVLAVAWLVSASKRVPDWALSKAPAWVLLLVAALELLIPAALFMPASSNLALPKPAADSPLAALATHVDERLSAPPGILAPASGAALGFDDVRGAPALAPSIGEGWLNSHDPERLPSDSLASLLNVKYWATKQDGTFDTLSADAPRAWMVPSIQYVADQHAVLERMDQPESLNPRAVALLGPTDYQPDNESDRAFNLSRFIRLSGASNLPTLRYAHRSPETVEIGLSGGGSGWLVVSDRFYPGWKVRAGNEGQLGLGQTMPLFPADGCLRAVYVPQQTNRVTFTYDPMSWTAGKLATVGGIVAWLLLAGSSLMPNFRGDKR